MNEEKPLKIKLEYELEVRDKNGKLISRKKGESHSFVKNFIQILRALLGGTSVSINDTGGASRTFRGAWSHLASSWTENPCNANAPAGNDTYGIQVGSSDAVFSKDNYSLGSKISHGTGSGQLLYGASTFETVTDTDTSSYFRITRVFTNNSGASVTVKELGIVIMHSVLADSTTYTYYFLILRDVLTSPSSVPDGATLTVRYKMQISY
jgi:hypothetical protein